MTVGGSLARGYEKLVMPEVRDEGRGDTAKRPTIVSRVFVEWWQSLSCLCLGLR